MQITLEILNDLVAALAPAGQDPALAAPEASVWNRIDCAASPPTSAARSLAYLLARSKLAS